jgi:hypothetical protein
MIKRGRPAANWKRDWFTDMRQRLACVNVPDCSALFIAQLGCNVPENVKIGILNNVERAWTIIGVPCQHAPEQFHSFFTDALCNAKPRVPQLARL